MKLSQTSDCLHPQNLHQPTLQPPYVYAQDVHRPPRRFPLYATSASRVILAYSPETLQEAVLAEPLAAFTNYSIIDREQMSQRLASIRQRGYEMSSNMRNIGVTGIAAPIFYGDGNVHAAISLIGPSDRMESHLERWISMLLQVTQEMSRLHGFS